MSKKFRVWVDSGANIYSRYEQEVTLEELGIDEISWNSMTEEEREYEMRMIAFDKSDWGYMEVEE